MSVSATIHRDSLICAACSSVTATKEPLLFNADQWTDEDEAAPRLLSPRVCKATVAGDVVMPTASTATVLTVMYLLL